jgi:hypothetical protein
VGDGERAEPVGLLRSSRMKVMARSSGRSWIRRPGANRDETVGVGDAHGLGENDRGDEKAGEAPWAAESTVL